MAKNKILDYIIHPYKLLYSLSNKKIIYLTDKQFLKLRYRCTFGEKLNLNNPQKFNEKLQLLKLNDRKSIYTTLVDKYAVKEYVSSTVGEKYVVPTLGIYKNFDEINFETLPEQFVIKCTHDSGGLVIVKDKNKMDKKVIKEKVNKSLKTNYYWGGREWPYKNVEPRILVEKYMEDYTEKELRDYKFYCFNGKCDYVMLCCDRFKDKTKFFYYDRNWNLKKEYSKDGLKYNPKISKPKDLDKMFEIAETLSKDIKFVRVDLYYINGEIYFGEMTFYPSSGFDDTRTKEVEQYLDRSLTI